MATLALIGGQYGSEGKGVIAAGLAHDFAAAVRTGGPNAGHSFYHKKTLYKMRSLPCAWVNRKTALFIGAGAVVDPEILLREVEMTDSLAMVDPHAVIIDPWMHQAEVDAGMRASIGSTTEGVGAARIAKIQRNGSATLAKDYDWGKRWIDIGDVAAFLQSGSVMLEGTQGSALSIHHGQYPFTTSTDTNAAQLAADAGMAPSRIGHTHLVVRTHPIRVAGNSGPTGGKELGWESFVERGVVKVPERTTVTNNVRRIFEFSAIDFERAVLLNDPCGIWITFGDYVDPDAANRRDWNDLMHGPMGAWLDKNINPAIRVLGIGVGGEYWRVIESGVSCRRPGAHYGREWPLVTANR